MTNNEKSVYVCIDQKYLAARDFLTLCISTKFFVLVASDTEVTFRGLIGSNLRNIPQTTNGSLFIETSAFVTTEKESHENGKSFGVDGRDTVLVNRNDKVMTRK